MPISAFEPNSHVVIVIVEDTVPWHGQLAASADEGMTMATNKKDGTQPSRSRKASEKSVSKSASRSTPTKKEAGTSKRAQPKAMAGSRSATKSQSVPAKSRSSAGVRTAAHSTSGTSKSRSSARTGSQSQISLLDPMTWLPTLETTLVSPQARSIMAEALRAVANVLEKPQGADQSQAAETQEGRNAVSAAGSLGAEIVAAPLQVAAAAIGAAGDVVTTALGGSSNEEQGSGNSRKGGRKSSRKASSTKS